MKNHTEDGDTAKSAIEAAHRRAPRLTDAPLDYGILTDVTGFPLKLAWIVGYTLLVEYVGEAAITPQRWSMLELVARNPGASQSQLGAALGLSRPATTLTIDFWQERGCVERRTEPNDRRSFGIYLTKEGEEQVAVLRQKVIESDNLLTANLTAEEITQLRTLLAKIHR